MTEPKLTDSRSESAWAALYQTASQQWAHAEQIRWTLLYNYLMASTILLLAWSAVFASGPSRAKAAVLVLLAVGGGALSALWVALGLRASGFVRTYTAAGHALESEFIKVAGIAPPNSPFAVARDHRKQVSGLARCASSAIVLWIVPTVFLFIYIALAWVPLRQLGGWYATVGTLVLIAVALGALVLVAYAYSQVPAHQLE